MVRKMANLTKIICPTCKGNGFYRVPYHLTHDEQYAQCDDCDRTGELTIEENHTPKELRDKGVI
jgi:DnaJ-class molecular chaperone